MSFAAPTCAAVGMAQFDPEFTDRVAGGTLGRGATAIEIDSLKSR